MELCHGAGYNIGMLIRQAAAALFAGLFALHFALAGAVAACPMWDHGTRGRSAVEAAASGTVAASVPDDMQGMTMLAMNGATETDESPCDHPVSPEQCRTMAQCTVGFLPAGPAAAAQPAPVTETIVAALVAMPPSVSFPPECRPPRA